MSVMLLFLYVFYFFGLTYSAVEGILKAHRAPVLALACRGEDM